jgi:hypothetical protein
MPANIYGETRMPSIYLNLHVQKRVCIESNNRINFIAVTMLQNLPSMCKIRMIGTSSSELDFSYTNMCNVSDLRQIIV